MVVGAFEESCGVGGFRGFIQKIRGKTMTHLMEICFNSRGRFMKITEFVTKRKPLVLVVPEGVKGNGWEDFRKAISSVQDLSDQAVYADVVAKEGPKNGALLPVGKWVRAVICESKGKVQDWFYVGKAIARMMGTKGMGSLTVKGGSVFLRRCSPRENAVVLKTLEGVTKVARDSLKLVDFSKVKLWVEMLPKVMLPTLLEVEDGAWSFTVAVSVVEEVERDDLLRSESTRSKEELMSAGGCVSQRPKNVAGLRTITRDNECYSWRPLPRSRSRSSVSNLASKAEKGWGGSLLGPSVGSVIGPTNPNALLKPDLLGPSLG
ncbi:hypothetical protein CK203_026103 [Vitis vinifera]|uniref:DUF4283 domain-containing protein n=1 Tax=Vitis vinifera TaxID=29760 RepID=A0A438IJ50_VITVI|nr:hypothetical protein CK203_026103 [Vitis vinifera]